MDGEGWNILQTCQMTLSSEQYFYRAKAIVIIPISDQKSGSARHLEAVLGPFLVFILAADLSLSKIMEKYWLLMQTLLGWEYPQEQDIATHSSTLAWRIPWTEENGGLQSVGSQRV